MKSANKHTLILTAATKVFAKKGFFNARISDIAKEAKVADGTIYLYFNNKYDILISIFDKEFGAIHTRALQMMENETDPEEMLRFFIAYHLEAMKKNKHFAGVIQVELRQAEKQIKEYRNTKFADYVNLIASIISHGQDQNIFRADVNPDIVKRLIYGALEETSRVWNVSLESNYSLDETVNQLAEILLKGLRKKQLS